MLSFISPKLRIAITSIYFSGLLALAVFPFASAGLKSINEVYVVSFRLDHLLHLLALMPVYPVLLWNKLNHSIFRVPGILIVSIVIALLTEGIQYYIPYRAYNPADLIANIAGALVGFILITGVRWIGTRYHLPE
jgi:VanZ family protein